jgi:small-conductance mechanosensitive channel
MESTQQPDAVAGVPETTPPGSGVGTVSPDGLWRWDGAQWQPIAAPEPPLVGYRSARRLAMYAVAGLVIAAVSEILSILAEGGRLSIVNRALSGQAPSYSEATTSDNLVRATALIGIAVLIGCAAVFLVWLFRIVANNHALGARALRFTPGWSVGWWFIPFANLVRPFQVVAEAWRASDPRQPRSSADGRATISVSPLVVAWWLAFILGNLIARFSVATGQDTLDGLHGTTIAAILSASVMLVAAFLAMLVVLRLTDRQVEQRVALGEAVAA